MSIRYALPEPEDFIRLSGPHEYAITIYAETSPMVGERETSFARVKSGFDAGLDQIREAGARFADRERLKAEWDAIATDDELWGHLAASIAIFLSPSVSEVYVLPNRLDTQYLAASYFDLAQLFRATTFEQRAFALLISANEWSLWLATRTERASRLTLDDPRPKNVDDATARDVEAGQDNVRRLIGEEGRKVLLETYAKRVSDAVEKELYARQENKDQVVFVFAAEPLLSMLTARGVGGWELIPVSGAPDRLGAAEIDSVIRSRLEARNAKVVQRKVDSFGDGVSAGLLATGVPAIARAAVESAIDTLVFDFTVDVFGTFDRETGSVEFSPDGGKTKPPGTDFYDVLSAIAVTTVERGGAVIAVREGEVTSPLWNGEELAKLRFAVGERV